MIKIDNVSKKYIVGEIETTSLEKVNLSIDEGEFVSILGPSGSGKSTLLRVISLLEPPTAGEVRIFGKLTAEMTPSELREKRRELIGMIFQNFNLIDYLSVYENIELPLIFSSISKKDRKTIVENLIKKMGLENRSKHRPNQLSGGQQQRVAISRALIKSPKVLLADEPTGNLDSRTAKEVVLYLKEISRKGTTVIMVTHDLTMAEYTDRILTIKDGSVTSDSKNIIENV